MEHGHVKTMWDVNMVCRCKMSIMCCENLRFEWCVQICGCRIWNRRSWFDANGKPRHRSLHKGTWRRNYRIQLHERLWKDVHVRPRSHSCSLCNTGIWGVCIHMHAEHASLRLHLSSEDMQNKLHCVSSSCRQMPRVNWANCLITYTVLWGFSKKSSHVQTECWQSTSNRPASSPCAMACQRAVALVLFMEWCVSKLRFCKSVPISKPFQNVCFIFASFWICKWTQAKVTRLLSVVRIHLPISSTWKHWFFFP